MFKMISVVLVTTVLFVPSAKAEPPTSRPSSRPAKKDAGRPAGKRESKPAKKSKKQRQKATTERQLNSAAAAMSIILEGAEFDEMPFGDFCEWLGRTAEVNVVVRWRVLEKVGVDADDTITFKEEHITVAGLLREVFRQLTTDQPEVELAAHADGNVLVITTREDIRSRMIVRVFDVQELLHAIPDFAGRKLAGDGLRPATGVGGGGGPGEQAMPDVVKELIAMLTRTVQPETWRVNGGRGTIGYFNGRLIVRNNLEVQQEIAGLLGRAEPTPEEERARKAKTSGRREGQP